MENNQVEEIKTDEADEQQQLLTEEQQPQQHSTSPTAATLSPTSSTGGHHSKQRSPLVYLKKRISKSGSGKKRRGSGHSDDDSESGIRAVEEDRANNSCAELTTATNRSLSIDSSSSPAQSLTNTVPKEKPLRGIFSFLKGRSKVRKSHSAPTGVTMDSSNSGQAPIATIDDDSFSSYATPMEAHSSGYSTPMLESNLASPDMSVTESFVEEVDEEQDETTVEENSKASPQASPAPVPASETLVVNPIKASLARETQPVEETLARSFSSANNSDCRPSPDVKEETATVDTQVESTSSPTPKLEEVSSSALSSKTGSALNQSAHCSFASCTATASSTPNNNDDNHPQHHDRSASIGEIRFCFTEAGCNTSPSRGFIRSLPVDPNKMDAHSAGDANGYPKNEHLYKVLVIGELGTGKTSIIKRYVHQFFSQHYRATIGVDFALKVVHWDQSTVIRLQLWDIAGQERFGNMTRVYYKEAVGAFIVFDVTRSSTFESVAKWKQDLDTKVQLPDGSPIPCVLLANKCDQPKEGIAASAAKLDEYCKDKGFAGWFETSAKDNINIDDAAKFLVGTILQNDQWSTSAKEEDADKLDLNGQGRSGAADLDKKKGGCC